MQNKSIEKAVLLLGTQVALAKACDVKQQSVNKWLKGGEYSAKYAARIECATQGAVTAQELCFELDKLDKQEKQ